MRTGLTVRDKRRLIRLSNMSIEELDRLNGKLVGKGCNWLTKERSEVCSAWAEKMAEYFNGKERIN